MDWSGIDIVSFGLALQVTRLPVNRIDGSGNCPAFPRANYLGLLNGVEDCQFLRAGNGVCWAGVCLQPLPGKD